MSSTVTTTTVSAVTTAITVEGIAQVFTLIALITLAVIVLTKEMSSHSRHPRLRALARGLDIGLIPLLVVFVVMVTLNATFGSGG